MADVPQLKEAFREGVDIHSLTAEELFGRVDRDTRNQAKTINFAILYGSSAWGIAGRLGVPKEEGKAIIDRYYERFPGIRAFTHATLAFVREHGFTRTLFGRKTHFEPNIRSPNPSIRGGAERAAINAPIQGTSADLIKRAMARMDEALAEAGLERRQDAAAGPRRTGVRSARRARGGSGGGDQAGHGRRRRAGDEARRAARRRGRLGRALGRRALTDGERSAAATAERPTPTWRRWPAAGGSTSSASSCGWRRGCRSCSSPAAFTAPAALGRFAYAVLTVEFAAQLASLGLRRGLAQLLADAKKPQACVVADAMLVAAIGSAIGMAILVLFPKAMYPTTPVIGMDRLLAITVLAVAWTDIALAALAYHHDVASTVRARSVVEPWTISIVAFAWSYMSLHDGLIVAYVFSMVAALVAALIPLVRCYGLPHGWRPDLADRLADRLPQHPAGRRRRGRMGLAPDRPRRARRVHARGVRRHLLCRAAGRDAAGQIEVELRAGARPGDHAAARGGRPRGGRQAGAAGDVLDHRRADRHRLVAGNPRAGGDGRWSDRASPAAPRRSASCSPPK